MVKESQDQHVVRVLSKLASSAPEPISHGHVPGETMAWLYEHSARMTQELLCGAVDCKGVPEVILSVDIENKRQLGHFKIGRDGLGLKWRISLNLRHLSRPRGDVLATLLHELLHAWQHSAGQPPKDARQHNLEFRELSDRLGIPTDVRGHDQGIAPDGALHEYLQRHKISGTVGLVPMKLVGKGKGSPLKKWTCSCGVNVRVAVANFDATCNRCGTKFELQE